MDGGLANGREVLIFFLNHNYFRPSDEAGQSTAYHRDDELRRKPISIPSNQPIGPDLLRWILSKGGFTEQEFIVYPTSDKGNVIVQSDKSIGSFDAKTGEGL